MHELYGDHFHCHDDYFRWRFFNESRPQSFLAGAFDEGQLIGTTAVSVSTFVCKQSGNEANLNVIVGHVISVLIQKKYHFTLMRKKKQLQTINGGLYQFVEDEAQKRGCTIFYCFPNANSYKAFVDQFNYSFVRHTDFLFLPTRASELLRYRGLKNSLVSLTIGRIIDMLYYFFKIGIPYSGKKYIVKPLENYNAVEAILPSSNFYSRRTRELLQWRIDDSPMKYETLGCYQKDILAGYAIFKTSTDVDRDTGKKLLTTKLVDFYFSTPCVGKRILKSIVLHAQNNNSACIFTPIISSESILKTSNRSGFLIMRKGLFGKQLPLVIKSFNIKPEVLKNTSMHLSLFDNDIV